MKRTDNDYHGDESFEMVVVDSLHTVLAESPRPGEVWLWCIFCERFFQAKYVRIDYLRNRQGCAFCDCAGFDCALFKWDTFLVEEDPGWPKSESELSHGMRLVETPASDWPEH